MLKATVKPDLHLRKDPQQTTVYNQCIHCSLSSNKHMTQSYAGRLAYLQSTNNERQVLGVYATWLEK